MTTDQVNHQIESNAYSGYLKRLNKDATDVSKEWLQISFFTSEIGADSLL